MNKLFTTIVFVSLLLSVKSQSLKVELAQTLAPNEQDYKEVTSSTVPRLQPNEPVVIRVNLSNLHLTVNSDNAAERQKRFVSNNANPPLYIFSYSANNIGVNVDSLKTLEIRKQDGSVVFTFNFDQPTNTNSASTTTTTNSSFYPNGSEINKLIGDPKATSNSQRCLHSSTKWLFEYKLGTDTPVVGLFKHNCKRQVDCNPKDSRWMNPLVGREVRLDVKGYNPYADSFAISYSFIDRHIEYGEQFLGLVSNGGLKSSTTTSETESTNNADPQSTKDRKDYVKLFEQLRDDLKRFYNTQLNKTEISPAYLSAAIGLINESMKKQLQIEDYSYNGITQKAEEFANEVNKADLENYFKAAREAATYYQKIVSYHFVSATSIHIKNADALKLDIVRYRNGVKVNDIAATDASREYLIRGGCKIDFSIGLFTNFLMDELYTTVKRPRLDTAYFRNPDFSFTDSIVRIDSLNEDVIARDGRGGFNIGPALLAHVYWRTGYRINGSITTGIALNQTARPRFLLGGSILFGSENRLIFSAGVAVGPVQTLDTGYSEGQVVDLSKFQNNKVPLKDTWTKPQWFCSFSYNLGGPKVIGKK